MRKIVLSLVVLVCLAASMQAAEPFVVLVDEERNLLLIPEGTAVPRGVEFTMAAEELEPRTALSVDAAAEPAAEQRRFVYAYAPAEKFVEARKRIAEARANAPESLRADDPGLMSIADDYDTYYFNFWDGSFHYMSRRIRNDPYAVQYTVHSYVYAEAGAWDTKAYINQYSAQYTYWNSTDTCWFYGASGTCYGSAVTLGVPHHLNQTVTATVKSAVTLTRYLYPPCDYPCKRNSSNTITVTIP
jgi:hypothetical protein